MKHPPWVTAVSLELTEPAALLSTNVHLAARRYFVIRRLEILFMDGQRNAVTGRNGQKTSSNGAPGVRLHVCVGPNCQTDQRRRTCQLYRRRSRARAVRGRQARG